MLSKKFGLLIILALVAMLAIPVAVASADGPGMCYDQGSHIDWYTRGYYEEGIEFLYHLEIEVSPGNVEIFEVNGVATWINQGGEDGYYLVEWSGWVPCMLGPNVDYYEYQNNSWGTYQNWSTTNTYQYSSQTGIGWGTYSYTEHEAWVTNYQFDTGGYADHNSGWGFSFFP